MPPSTLPPVATTGTSAIAHLASPAPHTDRWQEAFAAIDRFSDSFTAQVNRLPLPLVQTMAALSAPIWISAEVAWGGLLGTVAGAAGPSVSAYATGGCWPWRLTKATAALACVPVTVPLGCAAGALLSAKIGFECLGDVLQQNRAKPVPLGN